MRSITPAPWQVCCDPTDGPNGSVKVLSSHGCGVVCVVDGTGDEVVANADLLAAAPELLAALKDALDVMGDWGDDGDPAWAIRARDAIAKAEGGES